MPKSEIASMKEERTQVIQIMLSGQAGREINEDVFSHENCDFPPLLLHKGKCIKAQSRKS